jgi:hypothetical protein
LFFILIKLPNFLSDIHLGSPSKYATAFLKRMQTADLNLYKSEFIQNPVFYFSIYFSTSQSHIHCIYGFSPSLFSDDP